MATSGQSRQPADPFPSSPDWKRIGWKVAQIVNVLVLVALIVGLFLWPRTSLRVLWNFLIPVLPASFLIAPQLWRGICPLGTLNQWSSGLVTRRQLAGRWLTAANVLGIVLLLVLVPARRFLFNENGPVLGATIALVAVAAVVLGAFFEGRAGFCNAICPVLPVERVYGQQPLQTMHNHRCERCTLCIPKGCLEISPSKSIVQALGNSDGQNRWLSTPYGLFAGALPGFIIGYFTTSNGSWQAAGHVYGWVAFCSITSYFATLVVVHGLSLTRPIAMALLAAAAVLLYYWWAVSLTASSLDVPVTGTIVGRMSAIILVAIWLVRTWPLLQGGSKTANGRPSQPIEHISHGRVVSLNLCEK